MNITCLIDDMNSPLGSCIGNALEIAEVMRSLNGEMLSDIKELIYIMVSQILKYSNKDLNDDTIIQKLDEVINSGSALMKFKEMLVTQGVDNNLAGELCIQKALSVEEYLKILNRKSNTVTDIKANCEGYIHCIDAEKIGLVTRDMGGGRLRKEDKINYRVGIEILCKEGNFIKNEEIWARVHHDEEITISQNNLLQTSIIITSKKPEKVSRIKYILKSIE